MERIRVLIVDDEPLAREGIRLHLDGESDVEVVGECGDGEQAVAAVRSLEPDLLFLDIQMPGLDGFGVLEQIAADRAPVVVFVTAYDEFALRAFDAHALDYLLKPFDVERFQRTLQRARQQIRRHRRPELDSRLLALLEELRGRPSHLERVAVRRGGRIVFLRTEEVDWIEAAGNYVRLHVGKESYLLRETMSGLESKLDPERFLRIHRSVIVQIDRIREMEPLFQGEYSLLLRGGTRVTSSRGYRDRLQELIGESR
jgi:two-component system, LytTR family, response regulator